MTTDDELNAPWGLHFERDGTEDVAVISDARGEEILRRREFWLPGGDDPIPPPLAAMHLILIAPALLDFARRVAAARETMSVPVELFEAAVRLAHGASGVETA